MFDLKTRILIVDDMAAMRMTLSKIFKAIGFVDISEASDGNLAWKAIVDASPPFDLIISDWNMPNCSGLDLLKRVRAQVQYKSLPFLMVTAESEQRQIVAAIEAGVTNYIIKPFSRDSITAKLEEVSNNLNK